MDRHTVLIIDLLTVLNTTISVNIMYEIILGPCIRLAKKLAYPDSISIFYLIDLKVLGSIALKLENFNLHL